jgi:LAS superfamily LD-carboxypeptidase LdcB
LIAGALQPRQLTGLDDAHLVTLDCGNRLHVDAAQAFTALQAEAARAGFTLAIASSFRSCERQLAIWNGKATGARPIYDAADNALEIAGLTNAQLLHAILRFSALPGTSRHHWGTDVDVFDAGAVPGDYAVQLCAAEVAHGGVFDPLHCWLDARMSADQSHGFFRPYAVDRGGVAAERWHLSYAPLAQDCGGRLVAKALRDCWNELELNEPLLLRDTVEQMLPEILQRYVNVPQNWCTPP